jgi:hypothetical protein
VTLYLPHEVTEALSTHIAALTPLSVYAEWSDAAWRACQGSLAPLSFSFEEGRMAYHTQGDNEVSWEQDVALAFLYPLRPANAGADWRKCGTAAHHLLAWILRREGSTWPPGIVVRPSGITFDRRRVDDRLFCSLFFSVYFDAPLNWS